MSTSAGGRSGVHPLARAGRPRRRALDRGRGRPRWRRLPRVRQTRTRRPRQPVLEGLLELDPVRRRHPGEATDRDLRDPGLRLRRAPADGATRERAVGRRALRRAARAARGPATGRVRRGVLERRARPLRARARRRETAGRLAHVERRPRTLERNPVAGARRRHGRAADLTRGLQRLGDPHDGDERSRLQPARVPQRRRLAARHGIDRRGHAPVRLPRRGLAPRRRAA